MLNKKMLVEKISQETKLPKTVSNKVLNAIINIAIEELKKNHRIRLSPLGTLKIRLSKGKLYSRFRFGKKTKPQIKESFNKSRKSTKTESRTKKKPAKTKKRLKSA